MNDVKYRVGSAEVSNLPLPPFSEEACNFAAELSDALMKHPEARRYPDVMSFAFWCRKANLAAKKKEWEARGGKRLGRGLVFHVAPSNVPINFAFSYMFSLMAGNANIVRMPSKEFSQSALVCSVISEVLEKHPKIKSRTAMIQYAISDEITEAFSLKADARVIWGGDSTIAAVRSCKTKPKCIDLVFADRYSICILDGEAIEKEEPAKLQKLAEAFYNDTYLMDQNACSSPQVIFWRNASDAAKELFWNAVFEFAKKKYYLQAASSVDKYMQLCQDAVDFKQAVSGKRMENMLYTVKLEELPENVTALRGKCGYFYEYDMESYEDMLPIVTEKFQTITYHGIDPEEVQDFVIRNRIRGIDRIVPVGKSLDIDVIWDGYDIVGMLSRIVNLK